DIIWNHSPMGGYGYYVGINAKTGPLANSFPRNKIQFKSQPKVLVICEDSKSSKIYLEEASIFYRSHTEVLFDHIGKTDPLNIVSEAVSRSRKYDWVFCVIDRDNHDQINL
ncbi:MAG: hypothetical protein RIQ76_1026, partial [Pseudomonadota bacterium]